MDPIPVREGFGDDHRGLTLSPVGSRLAIFTSNRPPTPHTLVVHDTHTGQAIASTPVNRFNDIGFVDEGTLLLAIGKEVLCWRFAEASPEVVARFPKTVRALGVRPGEDRIILGLVERDYDATIIVCDWRTGAVGWTLPLPSWWHAAGFAFSSDSRQFAANLLHIEAGENSILVCEVATGRQLRVHLPLTYADAMSFAHEDDRLFVATGLNDPLIVYGPGAVDPLRTVPLPEELSFPSEIRCLTEGEVIEVMSSFGVWARVDLNTGSALAFSESSAPSRTPGRFDRGCGMLSADGRTAAVVVQDAVYVWEVGGS